ncbi:MAG TPA: hypothetical protein VNC78_03225 [Actinomycetota bacterium]|nr:hypothetical protein [Actinomycetota bacterium]
MPKPRWRAPFDRKEEVPNNEGARPSEALGDSTETEPVLGEAPSVPVWQVDLLARAADGMSSSDVVLTSEKAGLRAKLRLVLGALKNRGSQDQDFMRALLANIQARLASPILAFTIAGSRVGLVTDMIDAVPVAGWVARKVAGGSKSKDALYLVCVTSTDAYLYSFLPDFKGRSLLDLRLFDIHEAASWPRSALAVRTEASILPGMKKLVLVPQEGKEVTLELLDEKLGRSMNEPVLHLLEDPAATFATND